MTQLHWGITYSITNVPRGWLVLEDHIRGRRLNEMIFKILFSAEKSLISGDKPWGFYRMLGRKWMSCGLPGPLLCSAEWSQEEQKALLFRQCHRLDLASLQDMSWPETIILVPESRGCDSKWQPGRQCGWEEPLCSKGNNLFLCLASWLPRKPTMNAAEWTVPCGDVYLPLITVLGKLKFT